jgi:uncharacterized protein (TIGR03382 family)
MEECNAFDDDCDGVIDNGVVCGAGKVCFQGMCLTGGEAADAAAALKEPPPPEFTVRDAGVRAPYDGAFGFDDEPEQASPGGCAAGGGAGAPTGLAFALLALLRLRRRRR